MVGASEASPRGVYMAIFSLCPLEMVPLGPFL